MARIGIVTCSNCAQETNCSSVVCLSDMRKRKGFFDAYLKLELYLNHSTSPGDE